jgi:Domain of unknown function (DUF6894)
MPRYYFDLTDGTKQFVDEDGEELRDDRQARDCARAVLTDNLARPLSDFGTEMAVTVRDANGPAFVAKLSIHVK